MIFVGMHVSKVLSALYRYNALSTLMGKTAISKRKSLAGSCGKFRSAARVHIMGVLKQVAKNCDLTLLEFMQMIATQWPSETGRAMMIASGML